MTPSHRYKFTTTLSDETLPDVKTRSYMTMSAKFPVIELETADEREVQPEELEYLTVAPDKVNCSIGRDNLNFDW